MVMSQVYLKPKAAAAAAAVDAGVMDISTITADARMIMDFRQAVKAYVGGSRQYTAADTEFHNVADDTTLSVGNEDFAWVVWVYLDSIGAFRDFVTKAAAGAATDIEYWIGYEHPSLRFRFYIADGSTVTSVDADTLGAPSVDTWYMICAQYDSTNDLMKISVNAGTEDTAAQSTGSQDLTNDLRFGRGGTGAVYHDGRLSRAGFWKRLLTDAERTALYNSGNGKLYGELTAAEQVSLQSYWNLNEPSGNATDAHGSNDPTDNNSVTAANGPRTSNAVDEATAADHGTLAGFSSSQEIEAWSGQIAHGTIAGRTDDSVGTKHGRLIGPPDLSTDVPAVLSGKSVDLDGTNDYILMAADAAWNLGLTSAFTLSIWLKIDSSFVSQALFNTYNGTDGWQIYLSSSTNLQTWDGTTRNRTLSALSTDTWYHFCITRPASDTAPTVYVNGSSEGQFDGNLAYDNDGNQLSLGASNTGGSTLLDGHIKDARIYNVEKSAAEVSALNSGTDDTTGLVAQWDLGDEHSLANLQGGTCLTLDGAANHVNMGSSVDDALSHDNCFAVWFKTTDGATKAGESIQVPMLGEGSGSWLGVIGLDGGKATVGHYDGSMNHEQSTETYHDGLWHRMIVNRTKGASDHLGTVDCWVDGIKVINGANCDFRVSDTEWRLQQIGAFYDAPNFANATIDHVQFFDAVMSDANVELDYKGTDITGNLVHHWKFDDGPQGQGATIVDGDRVVIVETADGNRWTFSQGTPAQCPTWRVVGGKGQLEFDGVDDHLLYDGSDISTALLGSITGSFHASDNFGHILSSSSLSAVNRVVLSGRHTTGPSAYIENATDALGGSQDTIVGDTVIAADTDTLVSGESDGAAYHLFVGNNDETESVDTGSDSGEWYGDMSRDNFVIGAMVSSSGLTNEIAGNIEMILVMDRQLTADERTSLAGVYP